jgi:hypothetical protein
MAMVKSSCGLAKSTMDKMTFLVDNLIFGHEIYPEDLSSHLYDSSRHTLNKKAQNLNGIMDK